jgi:Patatin-like phospholipase
MHRTAMPPPALSEPATSPAGRSDVVELALCLAGGVSASCWTAGALDYLSQALDAWEDARGKRPGDAPPHRVLLSSVAGASGGAECAALWVPFLRTAFPPADAPYRATPGRGGHNPLHDGWVDGADAAQWLASEDGSDRIFRSLLDGSCTDRIASRNLAQAARQETRAPRDWVAEPLRVRFAVTNLEGTPLRWPSPVGPPDQAFVLHADHLSFCVSNIGGTPSPAGAVIAHDEQPLAWPGGQALDLGPRWTGFMHAAAASGAFPLLLPERRVDVAAGHWQPALLSLPQVGAAQPASAAFDPLWSPSPARDAPLPITTADGGVLNNVPLNLAQAAWARREAPESGALAQAHRAVLVIDPAPPRAAPQALPAPAPSRPHRGLLMLAQAVWNHARTSPREVIADTGPAGIQRFVLVPSLDDAPAGRLPLAGLALGGFAGYLDRELREHDFQRGRADARRWLSEGLTLPEDHPAFSAWSDEQRRRWRVTRAGSPHLPLIPLMPELAATPEPLPAWPAHQDRIQQVRQQLPRRLDTIASGLLHAYLPRHAILRLLARLLWRWLLAPVVCRVLLKRLRRHLFEARL